MLVNVINNHFCTNFFMITSSSRGSFRFSILLTTSSIWIWTYIYAFTFFFCFILFIVLHTIFVICVNQYEAKKRSFLLNNEKQEELNLMNWIGLTQFSYVLLTTLIIYLFILILNYITCCYYKELLLLKSALLKLWNPQINFF